MSEAPKDEARKPATDADVLVQVKLLKLEVENLASHTVTYKALLGTLGAFITVTSLVIGGMNGCALHQFNKSGEDFRRLAESHMQEHARKSKEHDEAFSAMKREQLEHEAYVERLRKKTGRAQ